MVGRHVTRWRLPHESSARPSDLQADLLHGDLVLSTPAISVDSVSRMVHGLAGDVVADSSPLNCLMQSLGSI